jgi:hypothetical protein
MEFKSICVLLADGFNFEHELKLQLTDLQYVSATYCQVDRSQAKACK